MNFVDMLRAGFISKVAAVMILPLIVSCSSQGKYSVDQDSETRKVAAQLQELQTQLTVISESMARIEAEIRKDKALPVPEKQDLLDCKNILDYNDIKEILGQVSFIANAMQENEKSILEINKDISNVAFFLKDLLEKSEAYHKKNTATNNISCPDSFGEFLKKWEVK